MLNTLQISDLITYQQKMPDCPEKELLNQILWEYSKYTECGTIEDCQQRKEWMGFSIDDIRKKFNTMVKGMREEVEFIREDNQPGKRGRPPKKQDGFQLEAPYPLGTKFYVLMYGYVEEQVLIGYKYRHGKLYMISDHGEWWELGVDAWIDPAEAQGALRAAIELEKRRRMEIGGNIGATD